MGDISESGDTLFYVIPDYEFTNQTEEKITNDTYKNKIHVVNFFFTSCPGICPIIMNNLLEVQAEFKGASDFMMLSHSLDPKNDSPEVMKNYGERLGADFTMWNLVTGKPEDIHNMSRDGYKLAAAWDDKAPGGINHTERVTLVDKEGHIRGWYIGTDREEIDRLIEDIHRLKEEYE